MPPRRRAEMFFRKKVGPEYYYERGEECLKEGNYQWAVESFTKAVEFDPSIEMAYYRRAEAYRKMGKTSEAILDCIRFLETDRRQPDMVEDYKGVMKETFKMARRGWEKDRVKEEIIAFGIPVLLDELIEAYDPRREYADKQFYQLALSWLNDGEVRDSLRIGFVQLLRGKLDEAIKELDRSVEDSPDEPVSYYLRGVAYLGKKRLEEGKASIFGSREKARELSQQARESFRQAVDKDPDLRLCPDCGYRASSSTNFCMHCGGRLLTAN